MEIRAATEHDAERIAEIYAPYVTDTAISFELDPPSGDAMRLRMGSTKLFLVAVDAEGDVQGYAYVGQFNARPAYALSMEISIYLAQDARGQGMGGALVDAALDQLRADGIANAFAGITIPNPASQALFESRGFQRVATYEQVGFKFDRAHDVGWWQLRLRELPAG